MATIAGDIREIRWANELGSGVFEPKSKSKAKLDGGGIRVDDTAENIGANGTPLMTKNMSRWSVETEILFNTETGDTDQVLRAQAILNTPTTYTFVHRSGNVWSAKGWPVGDIGSELDNGTISIKFSGGADFKKV